MLKVEKYKDLVRVLLATNQEFNDLYHQHIEYEQQLEALYSLESFPPVVEAVLKNIKLEKLKGKDRMLQILVQKSKNGASQ